jgi:hypothetical protein
MHFQYFHVAFKVILGYVTLSAATLYLINLFIYFVQFEWVEFSV